MQYVAICSTIRGRYDKPERLPDEHARILAAVDGFFGEQVAYERDLPLSERDRLQLEVHRHIYPDNGKRKK